MLGRASPTGSSIGKNLYELVRTQLTLTSWTESQLKAFADKHGIPVPQPRKRDTLLQKVRSSYETVAQKLGETAAYPGNWIYESWSESGKLFHFGIIYFLSLTPTRS